MLSKLQKLREEREQGFTLIELLVVILIIGILAAIAIPAFLNQRKSAVDSSVQSDVTNAAKQIETLAIKSGGQNADITIAGNTVTVGSNAMALTVSKGTVLKVTGSTGSGYFIQGTNPGGDVSNVTAESGAVTASSPGFLYDSTKGGLAK